MSKGNTVLIGADPEMFVRNPNSKNFISAHDMIPGTKEKPFPVPYGAVQVDGTALEFNIDPANTVNDFVRNINAVRKTMADMVPGYNVVAEPVAHYADEYFKSIPAEAKRLGCNPDYNGWMMKMNPPPNGNSGPFRTAAGHIHIGWDKGLDEYDADHFMFCCRIARQLDYYLGIQSLLWDGDNTRRTLYGKAGAFRPKTYGMEYRVLSNRWLDSDELMRWIFNTTQCAMADAFNDNWAEDTYGDFAQQVIDNNRTGWPDEIVGFNLGIEPLPNVESLFA